MGNVIEVLEKLRIWLGLMLSLDCATSGKKESDVNRQAKVSVLQGFILIHALGSAVRKPFEDGLMKKKEMRTSSE